MNALDRAEANALRLDNSEASTDDFLNAVGSVAVLKRVVRELDAQVDKLAIDFIKQNGTVTSGDLRYTVVDKKKVKVRSNGDVFTALLAAHEGDFEKLPTYLASDAWKIGAVRKTLGKDSPLIVETLVTSLESPTLEQELSVFNTRFLRREGCADE
jgi:hypothetical protein